MKFISKFKLMWNSYDDYQKTSFFLAIILFVTMLVGIFLYSQTELFSNQFIASMIIVFMAYFGIKSELQDIDIREIRNMVKKQ